MGIDDVGNFIEKGSTFLDGGLFPRGKSFPRGIYRSVDIGRRSFGTARKLVARSRTECIERFAIRSWLSAAIDEKAVFTFEFCIWNHGNPSYVLV